MYPIIRYKTEGTRPGTVTVCGCYGENPDVYLPDKIEGKTVTRIEDYGFARTDEEEGDGLFIPDDADREEAENRLCGEKVETVHLPHGLREIGRYAFYRCFRMKNLSFTDSLESIEGGAFTGCHLDRVEITCHRKKQTCLRQILEEQRFELEVGIFYEDGKQPERAELIFPEHYEEAVENTPARIVVTHYHGAGGDYRQCVYHKEIDYEEYDELFGKVKARENPRTLIRIALARLQYPYKLTKQSEKEYTEFLKSHASETAVFLFEKKRIDEVLFLLNQNIWKEESIEIALDQAEKMEYGEAVAILLEHRPQKGVNKTFEL